MNTEILAYGTFESSFKNMYSPPSSTGNVKLTCVWLENVSAFDVPIHLGFLKNGTYTGLVTNNTLQAGRKLIIDKDIGLSFQDVLQGKCSLNGVVNYTVFGQKV